MFIFACIVIGIIIILIVGLYEYIYRLENQVSDLEDRISDLEPDIYSDSEESAESQVKNPILTAKNNRNTEFPSSKIKTTPRPN